MGNTIAFCAECYIEAVNIKEEFAMRRKIIISVWLSMLISAAVAYSQQELYIEQLQSVDAFNVSIYRGAVSFKAGLLGVVSPDKVLKIYDLATLKEKLTLTNIQANVNAISFSASGQTVALGTANGKVYLYSINTETMPREVKVHSKEGINALVFQDESWIFSAGVDKMVNITEAVSGNNLGSLPEFKEDVTTLAIQQDAKNFAVGLSTGQVQKYAIGGLSLISTYTDGKDKISTLCYSPDSKYLAAGTAEGNVFVWDEQSGKLKFKLFTERYDLVHNI